MLSAFILLIVLFNMSEKPSERISINNKKKEEENDDREDKSKKDWWINFIFGEKSKIDLEYILKSLSWIIVSGLIIASGFAIDREAFPNPNSNPTYDKVVGILLLFVGAILGIFSAIRVSFAFFYPFEKKFSFPLLFKYIFSVGIALSLSMAFLQVMASFQVGKIISLFEALHVNPQGIAIHKKVR